MKLKEKKSKKLATQQVQPSGNAFNVDSFMAGLNKKYGQGTIFRASEAEGLKVKYLRTGCARLDFALGGGLPESRMIEIYGNESAGKTTLMLCIIREFQKKYENGLAGIIDFERSFDAKYAAALGVDCDRLLVVNPDHGEQGADLIQELVQAQTHIFLGVDSLAAMVPVAILEGDAQQQTMGVHARLVNRLMAKCNARMKRNLIDPDFPTTTVVFLNQQREKIGVMFGDPTTTPGGLGKNYFSSIRLKLFSSGSTKNKILVKQVMGGVTKEVLVGKITSFTVIKNKTGGTPFEDGEYKYFIKPHKGYPAWSFDNEDALFESGRFHGIIKIGQGGTFAYENISTKQPHLFVDALRKNPDVAEGLYQEVLDAVLKFNAGEVAEVDPSVDEVDADEADA